MRRSDREITNFDEIVEIFKQSDVCRIAIRTEDAPYILPLNFGMTVQDGNITLYFHGAKQGTKYEYINKNPFVSFELESRHEIDTDYSRGYCTMLYKSVIGHGTISFVDDETEVIEALGIICDHYHLDGFKFSEDAVPATRVMKLIVKDFTAKKH